MYFHVFVRWYELIEVPSKQNRIILTYANEYVVEIVINAIFNAVIRFDERTS